MRSARDRLREVIKEAIAAGETQGALAKRLGVAQSTISGWLGDEELDPRASVLAAVARELGINGHWLLTGEGEKYSLSRGADEVYATGLAAGLRCAEDLIRAARAKDCTSGNEPG